MNKREQKFVETVWEYYREHGRHDLPWRQTHNPYNILVSELMLQQTQVGRVIPKYEAFIKKYPTVQKLSKASLGDVLRLWNGLGYNRRAKFLLQCAKAVVEKHTGTFPTKYEQLLTLPGIGPYTAAAICAFAYNQPVELVETNVRQVYIHHFFKNKEAVTDKEILDKVSKTLPTDQARDWYAAIMDYGTHLKATHGNLNSKSKHYTKQSKFAGSNREVRGAIIRLLTDNPSTASEMRALVTAKDKEVLREQLHGLLSEQLIVLEEDVYRLP